MNKPLKIALIEDERGLQITLKDRLEAENYSVETFSDGLNGLQAIIKQSFDLILLDVMLPGKNGFDICRDARINGVDTPILMLTARGELPDKVVGLKLGADDYLTKPFEMLELLARVEVLLRRSLKNKSPGPDGIISFDNIEINFKSAEVRKDNQVINLSAQEFRLLKFFVLNQGTTFSRDELLNQVWDYAETPTTRTVDVHIAGLRQKLETHPKHPRYFITVHSLGYRFITE